MEKLIHEKSRSPITAVVGISLGLGAVYFYSNYVGKTMDNPQKTAVIGNGPLVESEKKDMSGFEGKGARAYSTDTNPPPPKGDGLKVFSKTELAKFNGVDRPQIYIAVKGVVYDVSTKPNMYGPNGSYKVFSGRDASRALALGSTKEEDALNSKIDDLNEQQTKALEGWIAFYEKNYKVVGRLE